MIDRRILFFQVCAGLLIFASLVLAQGYDLNWDNLNYHFYNGYAAVHHVTWSNIQVAMRQSYFFPWLDAVFYGLVVSLRPVAVALVLAALQSALYPLLFALSVLLLKPLCLPRAELVGLGTVLTLLGVLAPVNILEAGGAYGDNTSAVLVVAAVLFFALTDGRQTARGRFANLAAAGTLAGVATAVKLTNAPFAVGLAAAMAARLAFSENLAAFRQSLPATLAGVTAVGLGFLVVYGPWGFGLWTHFDNPFFPFFNQYFRSGFALPSSFPDPAFALPTLADKLLFPFQRNPLVRHDDFAGLFDLRMALSLPMAATTIVILLAKRFMTGSGGALAASTVQMSVFFLVSYVAWLCVFGLNRYMVTLELLAPLLCVLCFAALGAGNAVLWWGTGAVAAVFLGSAYLGRDMIVRRFDHRSAWGKSYFDVQYPALPDLRQGGALVAMLGDQGLAFTIPYFPPHTDFVRLAGSMYYGAPGYQQFARGSDRMLRAAVFGNKMGGAICRRLDRQSGPLFTLRQAGGPNAADRAALLYYGVSELAGQCVPVTSKADYTLWLCRAARTQDHECDSING